MPQEKPRSEGVEMDTTLAAFDYDKKIEDACQEIEETLKIASGETVEEFRKRELKSIRDILKKDGVADSRLDQMVTEVAEKLTARKVGKFSSTEAAGDKFDRDFPVTEIPDPQFIEKHGGKEPPEGWYTAWQNETEARADETYDEIMRERQERELREKQSPSTQNES